MKKVNKTDAVKLLSTFGVSFIYFTLPLLSVGRYCSSFIAYYHNIAVLNCQSLLCRNVIFLAICEISLLGDWVSPSNFSITAEDTSMKFGRLFYNSQADHLSGKPGTVRDFDSCQGNVWDFTKSQGSIREKILSGKSGQKLSIVSYIFASVQVFNSIQLVPPSREYQPLNYGQ